MPRIEDEDRGACAIRVRHYDAAGELTGHTVIELPEAALVPLVMAVATTVRGVRLTPAESVRDLMKKLWEKVEAMRPAPRF